MNATDIMTPEEIAELLRIPRSTVVMLLARGDIPGRKVGRRWRALRQHVEAYESGIRHKSQLRNAASPVGRVYFVQGASGGPVKIGFATHVKARVAGLQGAHRDDLVVLASVPGTMEDERDHHFRFAALRVRGEWFRPESPLLEHIAKVAAGR